MPAVRPRRRSRVAHAPAGHRTDFALLLKPPPPASDLSCWVMKSTSRILPPILCLVTLAVGMPAARAAAAAPSPAWRTVSFDGATFRAPASWPVYDLRNDPRRCVLLNVHAVYLGTQGPEADCPARAVGRTEAVQVQPITPATLAPMRAGAATATVAGRPAVVAADGPADHALVAAFPDLGVVATATFGTAASIARQVLASFAPAGATPSPASTPSTTAPAATTASAATGATGATGARALLAALRAGSTPGRTAAASLPFGATDALGKGFDTCTDPPLTTLQTWYQSSPYRVLGIYVGGANAACTQPQLSASYVASATAMGWNLIPIYVGLQAPCTGQPFATISKANAWKQGIAAANDAASIAAANGLPRGSPIYFDMEAYNPHDTTCESIVMTFLSAWTYELHVDGLRSGVYSNSASGITQLAAQATSTTFHEPDDLWIANWNGTVGVFGDPYISDSLWAMHQRLHQYAGGHSETWGGVTLNVDSDFADGMTVGAQSAIGYDGGGPNVVYERTSIGWGMRKIAATKGVNVGPVWSPDGSMIAFSSDRWGKWNIWVESASGQHPREITHKGMYNGQPSWSPDGSSVVFTSNRTGHDELYLIDVTTGALRQLTFVGENQEPAFSSDGQHIAFASHRTGQWKIWLLSLAGGLTQLTFGPNDDEHPSFAPDGATIAFDSTPPGGTTDIWIRQPQGSLQQVTFDQGNDSCPTWSPDGTMIAFQSDRSGQANVWLLNLTGGLTQLTWGTTSAFERPTWRRA